MTLVKRKLYRIEDLSREEKSIVLRETGKLDGLVFKEVHNSEPNVKWVVVETSIVDWMMSQVPEGE